MAAHITIMHPISALPLLTDIHFSRLMVISPGRLLEAEGTSLGNGEDMVLGPNFETNENNPQNIKSKPRV